MFSEGQKQRMLATLQTERKGLQANNSLCAKSNEVIPIFNIYPNPAIENVTIRFENAIQKLCTIFIINELGQILKTEKRFINKETSFEIADFSKGVYFLKIENQTKIIIKL
jgi:hypothetical protein